jgi:PadR family transcriptional regulator PadR
MISSDIIRGYIDTMILYLLLNEPSYGYEISKKIKELTDEKYIMKETTLYSAFKRMEANGYIESFSGEETYGKPRTYYRITEAGESYYREKTLFWRYSYFSNLLEYLMKNDTPAATKPNKNTKPAATSLSSLICRKPDSFNPNKISRNVGDIMHKNAPIPVFGAMFFESSRYFSASS